MVRGRIWIGAIGRDENTGLDFARRRAARRWTLSQGSGGQNGDRVLAEPVDHRRPFVRSARPDLRSHRGEPARLHHLVPRLSAQVFGGRWRTAEAAQRGRAPGELRLELLRLRPFRDPPLRHQDHRAAAPGRLGGFLFRARERQPERLQLLGAEQRLQQRRRLVQQEAVRLGRLASARTANTSASAQPVPNGCKFENVPFAVGIKLADAARHRAGPEGHLRGVELQPGRRHPRRGHRALRDHEHRDTPPSSPPRTSSRRPATR